MGSDNSNQGNEEAGTCYLGVSEIRWTGARRVDLTTEDRYSILAWQVMMRHMKKVCINFVKGGRTEIEGVGTDL